MDFSFSLTSWVAKEQRGKNLLLSPLSVQLTLAMAANGASSDTAKALLSGLGLPTDLAKSNAASKKFLAALMKKESGVDLALAQALWAFAPHQFAPSVVQRAKDAFGATLEAVTAQNAAPKINAWADAKTKHLIKQIVAPGDFNASTMFALSNATYFKGTWTNAFDPKLTQFQPFRRRDGSTRSVPMLQGKLPIGFVQQQGFVGARLPYGSGRFAFWGFLPRPGTIPEDLFAELGAIPDLWQQARPTTMEIMLPKLTLDPPRYDLAALFQKKGLLGRNDFSGLDAQKKAGNISAIFHKTRLELDEKGTTAAAATVAVVTRSMAPSIRFIRPFAFCLVDEKNKVVLFTGVVHDPS